MFKVSLSVTNGCLSIQSYIEAVSYLEFCLSEDYIHDFLQRFTAYLI